MKKGKYAFVIAALAAAAVIGAVVYVASNLNSIIEAAIERYGSEAAGTRVRVSSVDIRVSSAQGTITGLTVANPAGFSSPHIFRLGTILTRIEAASVTKTPVVFDEINISAPEVFYEINQAGVSNVDLLKKNLRSAHTGKKTPEKKAEGKETRLKIRKLVIEKGVIDVRIQRGDRRLTVVLPRVERTDIGGNGGATPAQVSEAVIGALAQEAAKAVARSQGEQYLRKGAEDLLKRYLQ